MVQIVNLHKLVLNKQELIFIPDWNKNHTLYCFFNKASANNIKACKLQRKSMLMLQPSRKKQHHTSNTGLIQAQILIQTTKPRVFSS